jgi:hypothetical protein
MDRKKLMVNLEMLIDFKLPSSKIGLSSGEARILWTKHNPNHAEDKPKSKKFTDYVFYAVKQTYRDFLTGEKESVTFLYRCPHTFMLGQESYGRRETIAVMR